MLQRYQPTQGYPRVAPFQHNGIISVDCFSEVLLGLYECQNTTRPFCQALSAKKRKRKQDKSGGPDESTVDEGQPQPVSSLSPALGLAEGASLSGDNIEEEEEGEVAVFADGSGEDLTSSSSVLEAALAFDIPFPSEASAGYDDSSEDNALFELPDVADLEKKRKRCVGWSVGWFDVCVLRSSKKRTRKAQKGY